MTDPISDMLTRIRNAHRALLPSLDLPHSRMKESIAGILKREGYIADFAVEGKTVTKKISLRLKYASHLRKTVGQSMKMFKRIDANDPVDTRIAKRETIGIELHERHHRKVH